MLKRVEAPPLRQISSVPASTLVAMATIGTSSARSSSRRRQSSSCSKRSASTRTRCKSQVGDPDHSWPEPGTSKFATRPRSSRTGTGSPPPDERRRQRGLSSADSQRRGAPLRRSSRSATGGASGDVGRGVSKGHWPAVKGVSTGRQRHVTGWLRGPRITAKVAAGFCRRGAQGAHRSSATGTPTKGKMPTGPMCDPWWH